MDTNQANKADLKKILELQYLAFQSEAIVINNFSIPPRPGYRDKTFGGHRRRVSGC